MSECTHENAHWVGDMPIADPVTYEFKGRFDVLFCPDCNTPIQFEPVGSKVPS